MRLIALFGFPLAMPHCHRVFLPISAPLLRLAMVTVLAGSMAIQPGHRPWAQASSLDANSNPESTILESPDAESPDTALPARDDLDAIAGPNRDFSWWPWILAFPALGVLLWWLLRNSRSTAESALPIGNQAGEMQTGALGPSDNAQALGTISEMDTEMGTEGGALGGDEPQTPTTLTQRIILVPRLGQTAYAYWELPMAEVEALTRSGYGLWLKLHNVADTAPGDPPVPPISLPCPTLAMGGLHLSFPQANRDYLAELGYEDETLTWHALARSAPVRALANVAPAATAPDTPPYPSVTAALVMTAAQTDFPLPIVEPQGAAIPHPRQAAWATLVPKTCRCVAAQWEISLEQVEALRAGDHRLTVRLYDVTELPGFLASSPTSVQEFEAELVPQASLELPITMDDRDYLIEVGYLTEGGQWQVLTKSSPVRVPACDPSL